MPRTTTVAAAGCPPLRALTFDTLGLVKVIEARHDQNGGAATMVNKWGDPNASNCVLSASITDRESDPIVAVARKCGSVDLISALHGDVRGHIPELCQSTGSPEDDAIVGVHLLHKNVPQDSESCTLLTTTAKGYVRMESLGSLDSHDKFVRDPSPTMWNACESGEILCSKVDEKEIFALFGGKRVEVNVWDLHKCVKIWTAKSPPKNSLGIFTPTCFTSATFLSRYDHRKFVAGTDAHQVRFYDISAQRRPVMSINFRETPIKAVAEDNDGHTVYIGNGAGDLASIDMRTGKILGCFIGKCSGSIRSIARHQELPVIASCGLDSYLRIWDIKSRQLLSAVFLKQHLTNVVFDSYFEYEGIDSYGNSRDDSPTAEPQDVNAAVIDNVEAAPPAKRKKVSKKEHGSKKSKSKKSSKKLEDDDD